MLVAVVQRWGWWIAIELSATKVIVLDSSGTTAASAGGNSLITHSITAEGIDEPGKSITFRYKGDETTSEIYWQWYTAECVTLFQILSRKE